MFFIFQSPPFFCIIIIPQNGAVVKHLKKVFLIFGEEIFSKKWLILLDKMFELWYNIKIGRARPCPSRKKSPPLHRWGSRLGLPSRRVKWSKSTKTLPKVSSTLNFPTMALGCPSMFGTLIDKSRREKQGVEPSYSTIRIPQTFPFRAVARPFLEVLL